MKHKKRVASFIMITLVSVLMGNSQLQMDGIILKDYPVQSILKNSLSPNEEMNFQHIILLPTESFDQSEAANIIKTLNKLPESLLDKIENKGVKVKLFSGKLTDNSSVNNLTGIIPRGYQSNKTWDDVPGIGGGYTVLVKIGASDKGSGHGSVNLELHELAHSIDSKVLEHYSKSKIYIQIWNKEKLKLFPYKNYFLQYSEEYFAETFAMYYMGGENKEKLKKTAPLTYKYITSIQ